MKHTSKKLNLDDLKDMVKNYRAKGVSPSLIAWDQAVFEGKQVATNNFDLEFSTGFKNVKLLFKQTVSHGVKNAEKKFVKTPQVEFTEEDQEKISYFYLIAKTTISVNESKLVDFPLKKVYDYGDFEEKNRGRIKKLLLMKMKYDAIQSISIQLKAMFMRVNLVYLKAICLYPETMFVIQL